MKDAVFDFLFDALFGRIVKVNVHTQIILFHEMVTIGMGVFIFLTITQALGAGVMGIAQVLGHGNGAAGFHFLQGVNDSRISAVTLVGGGKLNCGLGNGYARLGPTDKFRSLMGRRAKDQCHGVCQANVF